MGESTKAHLKELLESFDTAMLITRHGEDVHARPMRVAGVEGANTVWFVTGEKSPKAEEIRDDSRISATFQGKLEFVALSGRAALVREKSKIDELWQTSWKAWFSGKDDPNITLIRLTVTDAEYWDTAGTRGIRYAFEAARAMVTGTPPVPTEGLHGRLNPTRDGAPLSTKH